MVKLKLNIILFFDLQLTTSHTTLSHHFTIPFYLTMFLNRRQSLLFLCDFADLDRQIGKDDAVITAAQNAPLQRLARRQRCYWMQPWLLRSLLGQYERLMQEL